MSRRTLITLAVSFTVVAFLAAEADFWRDHQLHRLDLYESNLLSSLRVAHRGDIEIDEAGTTIVAMSPDAVLEIGQRRLLTRRRLEVKADATGLPRFEFTVGARQRSEEDAREFLTAVMPQIVRSTGIGARSQTIRLLESGGIDALLDEMDRLSSNSARQVYVEAAIRAPDLTEEAGLRIIRSAGREISSSARLRAVLVSLADELPGEWDVTTELLLAAERIASSSEKAVAITEIVRQRGLTTASAPAAAEAIGSIAAASDKGRAIVRIARIEPSADVLVHLVRAADTIESSSERRRVLEELVASPELDAAGYAAALEVGSGIAASAEKASFLLAWATSAPPDADLSVEYLRVASSIAASSERARALVGLLQRSEPSPQLCAAWLAVAGEVASSTVAADLLVEAASRCPSDRSVWEAFLQTVEQLAASSEQRRALVALLTREDLTPATIEAIATTADRAIAAASERLAVIRAAEQRPAASVDDEGNEVPEGEASGSDSVDGS